MELFYKSFFLTRAVLRADAQIPKPVDLPDSEDRLVAYELQSRRDFPLVDVLDTFRAMAQPDLLEVRQPAAIAPTAEISETDGLREAEQDAGQDDDLVSITPQARPAIYRATSSVASG
jgi:hypothetical protein